MPKLEKSTSRTCWARQLVSFAALSEITTSHWSRAVISQTNDSWSLSWGVDCILEINKEQFRQLVDSIILKQRYLFGHLLRGCGGENIFATNSIAHVAESDVARGDNGDRNNELTLMTGGRCWR